MTEKFYPLSELANKVKKLNIQQASGTLFVVTKSNTSLQILFDKGEVTHISFKNLNGIDALEKIADIQGVQFKFMKDFFPKKKKVELPATQLIIEMLSSFVGYNEEVSVESIKPEHKIDFNNEELKKLKEILVEYIGPMSEILCDEYYKESSDFKELIEKLSKNIPNEKHALDFMSKCIKTFNLN